MRERSRGSGIGLEIAVRAAALAGVLGVAGLLGRGCTAATEASYDAGDAEATAEAFGFTNPEVTEVNRWFVGLQGCDKNDTIGFEMTATNPQGQEVDLLVCKGLTKAATVRQQ